MLELKPSTDETQKLLSPDKNSGILGWANKGFDTLILNTAAAKSLQSCPTLCNPIDSSPPGSPVPMILQARTLEWVAIYFSIAWKWKVKAKLLGWVSDSSRPHGIQPTRLLRPWDFPGKSTGVSCHYLLQVITSLFFISVSLTLLKENMLYSPICCTFRSHIPVISYRIYPSLIFCLVWYLPSPSMLLQIAKFLFFSFFFLWLSRWLLYLGNYK